MNAPITRLTLVGRYYNFEGGISRCMAELAIRAARTIPTRLITHELLGQAPEGAEIITTHLNRRPRSLEIPLFSLRAAYRARPYRRTSIVHAHGDQFLGADIYTAHSCHNAWLTEQSRNSRRRALASSVYPRHVIERTWERLCFGRGDAHIIAVSGAVAAELTRELGISESRISVVHNGVDTRRFTPGTIERTGQRLVFVGYEFRRKGLGVAIEALARSARRDVTLDVIGGADRAPFVELARRLGVADRVRFMGHQSDVVPFFQGSDALILPTRYEPFGLVILEALACGTPVITSATAGAAELMLGRGGGVLLSDVDDADEAARAIDEVLASTETVTRMSAEARAIATENDWDAVWERTLPIYSAVAASKGLAL